MKILILLLKEIWILLLVSGLKILNEKKYIMLTRVRYSNFGYSIPELYHIHNCVPMTLIVRITEIFENWGERTKL